MVDTKEPQVDISIPDNPDDSAEDNPELASPRDELRQYLRDSFEATLEQAENINIDILPVSGFSERAILHKGNRLGLSNSEAAELFFLELMDFVDKATDEGHQSTHSEKKTRAFIAMIRNEYLSASPNIYNYLSTEAMLNIGAAATRDPGLQGFITQPILGELSYELTFAHEESLDRMVDLIKRSSPEKQIDMLDFLRAVVATAIADGDWAIDGVNNCEYIVEKIEEETERPLVRLMCRYFMRTVDLEWNEPSYSVIKKMGDSIDSRIPEASTAEEWQQSSWILDRITPDVRIGKGWKALFIARDMVALLDHANMPQYYAPLRHEELEKINPPVSNRALSRLEEITEVSSSEPDRIEIPQLLNFLKATIIDPFLGNEDNVSEDLAGSIGISKQQFEQLLHYNSLYLDALTALGNTQTELREIAEKKNEELSQKLVDDFYAWFVNLSEEEQAKIDRTGTGNDFISYYEEENFEASFSLMQRIIQFATINVEDPLGEDIVGEEIAPFYHREQELREFHEASINEANSELGGAIEEANERTSNFSSEYLSLLDAVGDNLPGLLQAVSSQIDSKLDVGTLQTISFSRFSKITSDSRIYPFLNRDEDIGMLQTLYRPAIIREIEDNLGIDIRSMNLSSQISFIRFLAGTNWEQFERVGSVLEELRGKREVLASFLACAEDRAYGEQILDIAEKLGEDSGPIFEKYAGMVERIAQIEKYVADNFSRKVSDSEFRPIIQEIIKRSREALLVFNLDENPKVTIDRLDGIDADLIVLASVTKANKESGHPLELSEINKIQTEVSAGEDIPEQDKVQMRRVLDENWGGSGLESIHRLVSFYLEGGLASSHNRFYRVLYEGKIIAFQQFIPQEDGTLYAASNNVTPQVRGSGIGTAIGRSILTNEAESAPVRADVPARNAVFEHYLSQDGFVAERYYPNYHETGESFFGMLLDKNNKLINLDRNTAQEMPYDPDDESSLEAIGKMLEEGYVMVNVSLSRKEAELVKTSKPT